MEIPLSPTLSPLVPRGERENLCRYQWGQRGGGTVHQPHPTSHALVASPGGGSSFERAARDPEWNSAQAYGRCGVVDLGGVEHLPCGVLRPRVRENLPAWLLLRILQATPEELAAVERLLPAEPLADAQPHIAPGCPFPSPQAACPPGAPAALIEGDPASGHFCIRFAPAGECRPDRLRPLLRLCRAPPEALAAVERLLAGGALAGRGAARREFPANARRGERVFSGRPGARPGLRVPEGGQALEGAFRRRRAVLPG